MTCRLRNQIDMTTIFHITTSWKLMIVERSPVDIINEGRVCLFVTNLSLWLPKYKSIHMCICVCMCTTYIFMLLFLPHSDCGRSGRYYCTSHSPTDDIFFRSDDIYVLLHKYGVLFNLFLFISVPTFNIYNFLQIVHPSLILLTENNTYKIKFCWNRIMTLSCPTKK